MKGSVISTNSQKSGKRQSNYNERSVISTNSQKLGETSVIDDQTTMAGSVNQFRKN